LGRRNYVMTDLGIVDLLKLFGFADTRSKLVRHQDKRYDVRDLLRRGWFETYQSTQKKPVFDNLDRIVSFIGLEGSRALLTGIYQVGQRRDASLVSLPPGCPHADWVAPGRHHYDLKREPEYAALENRVVIDWGPGALAWHQRTTNKVVLEIRPPGASLVVFKDYLEFTLTFRELRELFRSPEANGEWRARLSSVAGIYLILATRSGHQYIGSATGADGIWGRWANYADNGHGGNAELEKLIQSGEGYPDSFTFSILQILPLTTARAEVVKWEGYYKDKLGSRATGLNRN
jgi:hypothetical protein